MGKTSGFKQGGSVERLATLGSQFNTFLLIKTYAEQFFGISRLRAVTKDSRFRKARLFSATSLTDISTDTSLSMRRT